ncbi:MAG: DUF4830 domain-containing protein [Clostridia bacterium]|nr:DUF4830 domain-containing protein [Clostridia bacterium]
MFIYSFRASTLRFFALLILAAGALAALIIFVPAYEGESYSDTAAKISYDKIETNEDRIAFLSQFGYKVSGEPIESVELTLPDNFDRVFSGYNELQKAQGLDLAKYKGKTVTRYTYEVTDYPGHEGEKIYANLIVRKNRIIAGDICSAEASGFIHGFERENQE